MYVPQSAARLLSVLGLFACHRVFGLIHVLEWAWRVCGGEVGAAVELEGILLGAILVAGRRRQMLRHRWLRHRDSVRGDGFGVSQMVIYAGSVKASF